MKKNTLAKWMLAGAVMVVSFACQSQTTSDSKQVPNDETEVPKVVGLDWTRFDEN